MPFFPFYQKILQVLPAVVSSEGASSSQRFGVFESLGFVSKILYLLVAASCGVLLFSVGYLRLEVQSDCTHVSWRAALWLLGKIEMAVSCKQAKCRNDRSDHIKHNPASIVFYFSPRRIHFVSIYSLLFQADLVLTLFFPQG